MKGKDLINWIKKHNAENLEVIILHRDEGGYYCTAEHFGYGTVTFGGERKIII